MFRLFTPQGVNVLWKCSHFVASCVTKKQVSSFLLVNSTRHQRLAILARRFSTDSPAGKDALQTNTGKSQDEETLDLDRWKSIMRSQAAFEEKQVNDEAEARGDDGENLREPGGDSEDGSSLESTRDLVAMWRAAGRLVPQKMTDLEVQKLAELTTKSARKKYLKFLGRKEGLKRAYKEKQQQKRAEREACLQEKEDDQTHEVKNTFLLQYWNRSLEKLLAWTSAQAMLFGQPLVFDMSYESAMSRQNLGNTVTQLMMVEALNRRAAEPFHLHFCNLQPDGQYMQELLRKYGAETWDRLFITSTDRQHVDVFPREQLVYLTADSPNVLKRFDHSKVYIVGAIVDRSIQTGLSLANAKRLKLATARLPLDNFLHWGTGAKNLTLDQIISIMLTVKDTGKWEEALKFVPQRKHKGFYQKQTQTTNTSFRVIGVTDHVPRDNGDRLLQFRERNSERTFKSQSQPTSHEESVFSGKYMKGLTSDGRNMPAGTRVRTSLKSHLEPRSSAGKSKI